MVGGERGDHESLLPVTFLAPPGSPASGPLGKRKRRIGYRSHGAGAHGTRGVHLTLPRARRALSHGIRTQGSLLVAARERTCTAVKHKIAHRSRRWTRPGPAWCLSGFPGRLAVGRVQQNPGAPRGGSSGALGLQSLAESLRSVSRGRPENRHGCA